MFSAVSLLKMSGILDPRIPPFRMFVWWILYYKPDLSFLWRWSYSCGKLRKSTWNDFQYSSPPDHVERDKLLPSKPDHSGPPDGHAQLYSFLYFHAWQVGQRKRWSGTLLSGLSLCKWENFLYISEQFMPPSLILSIVFNPVQSYTIVTFLHIFIIP